MKIQIDYENVLKHDTIATIENHWDAFNAIVNHYHKVSGLYFGASAYCCKLYVDVGGHIASWLVDKTIHQLTSVDYWCNQHSIYQLKHWCRLNIKCQLTTSSQINFIRCKKSASTSCRPTSSWRTPSSPSCASPVTIEVKVVHVKRERFFFKDYDKGPFLSTSLTSLISSGRAYTGAPIFRAMLTAYLALERQSWFFLMTVLSSLT